MILNEGLRELLRGEVEMNLPGEQAHISMAPLSRPLSSEALKKVSDYRTSAVAVVLTSHENELSLLLIQRPDYEGAHSGQISFPGGKKDEDDVSPEQTARRECFEEIGIILSESSLIGKLTDVYIPVSNFLVHPFLYLHSEPITFVPDEREVSEILIYPVQQLTSPDTIGTLDIRTPQGMILKNIPCFQFGEKKIWGATALVLNELREIIQRLT
jgi:8-oxo-dGTP pyrophosphatase MutT (NUDIX family)